jgi:hypothetical protein
MRTPRRVMADAVSVYPACHTVPPAPAASNTWQKVSMMIIRPPQQGQRRPEAHPCAEEAPGYPVSRWRELVSARDVSLGEARERAAEARKTPSGLEGPQRPPLRRQ